MNIAGITGLNVVVTTKDGAKATYFPTMALRVDAESYNLDISYTEAPAYTKLVTETYLCGEWKNVEVEP